MVNQKCFHQYIILYCGLISATRYLQNQLFRATYKTISLLRCPCMLEHILCVCVIHVYAKNTFYIVSEEADF